MKLGASVLSFANNWAEHWDNLAFFCALDESFQHISYSEDGTFVDYVVSGAASRTDRSTKNEDKIPNGSLRYNYPSSGWNPFAGLGFTTGAFIYAELTNAVGQFDFYNGDGEKKYSFQTLPRNKFPSNVHWFESRLYCVISSCLYLAMH